MVLVINCGVSPDLMPFTSERQRDLSLPIGLPEESNRRRIAYTRQTTLRRLQA
jgi:hypothetical protein